MSREPEFYVGYQQAAPAGLARVLRARALALVAGLVLVAALLVAHHALRPPAAFDYGAPVELTGTLAAHPYPALRVAHPGAAPGADALSSYLLVAPFKHGADALVAGFDGMSVRLRASLAYRDGRVVAEVVPGSLRPAEGPALAPPTLALGRHTLRGEIVDSKCFFGVMNPGEAKPHRACAARCISGGVPPVLCVRDADGRAAYLVLVSGGGEAIGPELLDLVAEPVEVTGQVERCGDNLVLRADRDAYRRLP